MSSDSLKAVQANVGHAAVAFPLGMFSEDTRGQR